MRIGCAAAWNCGTLILPNTNATVLSGRIAESAGGVHIRKSTGKAAEGVCKTDP
jgi:hypothetical protein